VTLTIARLVTRGKIHRELKVDSGLVQRVARERFAAECSSALQRPWPVQPKVARIRQLRVRVTIPAAQLTADALAAAWTAAFVRELFAALAHPDGTEIIRFESHVEYLASAIRALLTGAAGQGWVYEEFALSFRLGTAGTAFVLFAGEPSEIVPTLLLLQDWSLLDRLLAVWDAGTLERLFLAIESTSNVQDEKLTVEDLLTVARLLLSHRLILTGAVSSRKASLGERTVALKLFLGLAREADWRKAKSPSPLRILRALRVLDALLDLHQSVTAAGWQLRVAARAPGNAANLSGESLLSTPADGVPTGSTAFRELLEKLGSITNSETRQKILAAFWNIFGTAPSASATAFADLLAELGAVFTSDAHRQQIARLWNIIAAESNERRLAFAELLGELTAVVHSDSHRQQITLFCELIVAGNSESRTAFAALFEELASATDSGSRQGQTTKFRWITTESVGLFLLISLVERLGWADRLSRLTFGTTTGPRLLTYTLASLASSILGHFDATPAYLDPGLALFSGWMEAPDPGGLRRFLASESDQARRDLLHELLPDEVTEEDSLNWEACFDSLANHLIRAFAGRIRGFGRSSRQFVVKNFLALPGRIRVEETRLLVVFTSSPLNAVIHMSRLDDPVEAVGWLGGRRVEFEPYGL
jgi:hypothetical protein